MGETRHVSPHFFRWEDIICHVPPLFLFTFYIQRSSKYKSDVCHILCEVLFMLDVTHSQVDVETEFGVVSLDSVSLSILASIKWYLPQVSRDRERWFAASLRHSTQCGLLLERLFSWNSESLQAHMWETTAQHGFGSRRNVTCFFSETLVATYSETDSVKYLMMLVYIDIAYFCDWKPGRFRTTSLRKKSNKFRYETHPFNNL